MNDATREEIQPGFSRRSTTLQGLDGWLPRARPCSTWPSTIASSRRKKPSRAFSSFKHTPPKTHALSDLIGIASTFAPIYATLLDAADRLNLTRRFRYPAQLLEPSRADYEQALADADEILRVTLSLIPREAHPPRRKPAAAPETSS